MTRHHAARSTALLLLLILAGPPALAQDFIETSGPLSDDAFYRLVSCGAPPDQPCAKPVLHWPVGSPVTVGLVRIDDAFLGGKQARARAAIARAVQYLNEAGFGLTLAQRDTAPAIRVHLVDTDGSAPLTGTGIAGIDGTRLKGARVLVRARNCVIQRADIVLGTRLHIRHYESAMLEEITQALGLLTDIRNPEYEGVSVFSEDSNASKKLGPQDIMALRRHYPGDPQ